MIPVGAIFLAARAVHYASKSGQGGSGPPKDPDNQSGWIALSAFLFLPLVGGFLAALLDGSWGVLPFLVVCSIPLLPWWWVRRVFIPLGFHRVSYRLTLLAQVNWNGDFRGAQGAAAAWALLRKREVQPGQVEWVEARLLQHSWLPVKGSVVLAHALLAARTNRDDARRLMTSIDWLAPAASAGKARKLATEWLACDAAERGDWEAAAKLKARLGGKTRQARLLIALGRRFTRQDPPFDVTLWLLWALSPRRRATWRLVREAVAFPRRSPAESAAADEVSTAGLSSEEAAIHRHVAVLGLPAHELTASRLLSLAVAWEEAFAHPAPVVAVSGNAALEAVPGLSAAARAQVLDDLALLVRTSRVPHEALGGVSPLLDEALRRSREALLADFQAACRRLEKRVADKQALPAIDEWRELVALRLSWEDAVARGGKGLCPIGFASLHYPANSLAVWLFNQRSEKPLANAIHRWLALEAKRAGDTDAEALETKNSRIRFT